MRGVDEETLLDASPRPNVEGLRGLSQTSVKGISLKRVTTVQRLKKSGVSETFSAVFG